MDPRGDGHLGRELDLPRTRHRAPEGAGIYQADSEADRQPRRHVSGLRHVSAPAVSREDQRQPGLHAHHVGGLREAERAAASGQRVAPQVVEHGRTNRLNTLKGVGAVLDGGWDKSWPRFLLKVWNQAPTDAPQGYKGWDRLTETPNTYGGKQSIATPAGPVTRRSSCRRGWTAARRRDHAARRRLHTLRVRAQRAQRGVREHHRRRGSRA